MAGIVMDSRQFERLLKDNGYRYDHQTGDHRIFKKKGYHHISFTKCNLNPLIVQRLIKEHNLKIK